MQEISPRLTASFCHLKAFMINRTIRSKSDKRRIRGTPIKSNTKARGGPRQERLFGSINR